MLNIVVIEIGQVGTALEPWLTDAGHRCLTIPKTSQWPELVKQAKPDLVIINVPEPSSDLLADLQAVNRQSQMPVILFAAECSDDCYGRVLDAQVSAFIVNGLDCRRLPSIMRVAMARFKQQQALKNALEEARNQLEDRKQIDRAKAILIKTRNFTEDEAYHTLRKLAMDRNITLGEMARNVIAMADLLK